MRTRLFALLFGAFICAGTASFAQTDRALLRELAQDNKQAVEALVLYPEETRLAILEAAQHPEALIKMQGIRQKTAVAFRRLIEDFPQSAQAVFYDLARFPGLTADLIDHANDREALRLDLQALPETKRAEALGVVERQATTLRNILALQQTAENAFDQLIRPYPPLAQRALRRMTELPEVLDILNDDLRFTILVGEAYRDDRAWVLHKMDSLHLAIAREQAAELENWKQTVENDPAAREELQASALEYASEYGYTDEYFTGYADDLYAEDNAAPQTVYVERYYSYSYPYWFGYPWWAPQPCWRPYPYWWYWGFYPYRETVVIVQFPSFHFMHWYFYHPEHHHRYNRLSTHFVNHYYGHRNSGSTISMGVGAWRDQNRRILSDEWLANPARLPARLEEYARFETERQKFNTQNPRRPLERDEFLKINGRQYPELERSREAAQVEIQREQTQAERQRSDWAPAKAPAKADPTAPSPRPIPAPTAPPSRKQPDKNKAPDPGTPRPDRRAQPPATPPDIDKARDYHREKWQEPRQPAQRPQAEPSKKPTSAPNPPKTSREKPKQAPKPQKQRGG
ncbi:MAG: DUF3300 domain-containing protein [Saprospiraceae bacterium]|nr:DUF3300 domain-containing protein [Saprospiraceae bacterium]